MTAWGGGKSQSDLASPIRDSIRIIPPLKLSISDTIGNFISDNVTTGKVPINRTFKLSDNNTTNISDNGGIENE